jgi:Flp pilus assembly pilin Flp
MHSRRDTWRVLDSGQGLMEYALILGLTSLAIVSALLILRNSIGSSFNDSGGQVNAAAETAGYDPALAGAGGDDHDYGTPGNGQGGNGQGSNGKGNGNGGSNGRGNPDGH